MDQMAEIKFIRVSDVQPGMLLWPTSKNIYIVLHTYFQRGYVRITWLNPQGTLSSWWYWNEKHIEVAP
jgi:hypothetical protein